MAWACARYRLFFEAIQELESGIDLHIIGGDLFDRVPSMDELTLYFDFVKDVKVRTILPYVNLHKKGGIESCNTDKPLFTHVRGEIPPHVTPEVDLDRFNNFPVVYAGDLHSHSNTQRNIVYPGSPMTTSFHREVVKTGYILIEPSFTEVWTWHEFNLPQLLRKTVESEDEMIATDFHHTIYEIEGDVADLANIKNSELLDKKVVKRSSEATLNLKDLSMEEELVEYLSAILNLNDGKIKSIMGVFNDYSKNATLG